MTVHPPIVRRFTPPTPAEVAARRADIERFRREQAERREREAPARRAALADGPALRDLDAAVECRCGCHPRPADAALHDGGASCPCQQTPEQRVAARERLRALLDQLTVDGAAGRSTRDGERDRELAEEATALGVTAHVAVSVAPFVIVGSCDGRGFYLRERHGTYRVTIAPDEDPSSDPWHADAAAPCIDIADGDGGELVADGRHSAAAALRVAVAAVRTALARNACEHTAVGGADHCPSCGVKISEADQWRWSSSPGEHG